MKIHVVVLLGAAATVLGSVSAASGLTVGPAHHRTVEATVAGAVTSLSVSNDVGDIVVIPGSVTRIVATEQYTFNAPTVRHSLRNGVLSVIARCPRTAGPVDVGLNDCAADLVMTLPRDVAVDAMDSVGDIRVRDLRGNESLRSDVGDIVVDRVTASSIRASSSDGELRLNAVRAPTVNLRSDSGDIRADLAAMPRAVVARSSDGDVSLTLPAGTYAVDTHTDDGTTHVRGITDRSDAQRSVSVRTSDGDIRIDGR